LCLLGQSHQVANLSVTRSINYPCRKTGVLTPLCGFAGSRSSKRRRKALSAQDAYVKAQQAQADIPVVKRDDLRWADGIAWGTPTRYRNMSAS